MRPLLLVLLAACECAAGARWGGELRLAIASDPKTFHPLLVTEQSGALVRYTRAKCPGWLRTDRAS